MASPIQRERVFAQKLVQDFVADGYECIEAASLQPPLPSGYVPDLIFRQGDEVIVIELKSSEEHRALENIRALKDKIEAHPNWKFRLYIVPREDHTAPPKDNLQGLENLLKTARQLNKKFEFEAASVVLWIALEIILRTLLANRQSRPNLGVSGMSMARSLSSLGELSEDDLRLLDQSWRTRNLSAHGYRLEPHEPIRPEIVSLATRLAEKVKEEAASNA